MVETYWHIGKQIYEAQGENERAEYGKGLLKFLSEKLTAEFGKDYDVRNLSNMRAFYIAFSNWNAVRSNLSWTHYRMLLKVEDENARQFYLDECAKSTWSTRQIERQINTFYYQHCFLVKTRTVCEMKFKHWKRVLRQKILFEIHMFLNS